METSMKNVNAIVSNEIQNKIDLLSVHKSYKKNDCLSTTTK